MNIPINLICNNVVNAPSEQEIGSLAITNTLVTTNISLEGGNCKKYNALKIYDSMASSEMKVCFLGGV